MSRKTVLIFYLFLLCGFLSLTGRLSWLTVVKGNYYRQLAEENRIRIIKKPAPRGIIYDRKGRVLARNVPVYKQYAIPARRCYASSVAGGRNTQYAILSREEVLKLEAEGKEAEIETTIGREYPYGPVLAHVVGYLGEVTENELNSSVLQQISVSQCCEGKYPDLQLGDLIGRTGVEQTYDCLLRGVDGGELVEVNTNGQILKKIGEKEPVPGQSITLSIDAELQKTAFEALKGKKGAIVASDPETGEILTLASSPSYDPNLIEKILNDPNQPLFNRAISGLYPPGSTFKIITAVAGLEEGKIDRNFEIDDPGIIFVGPYKYANWYFTQYGRKEGLVNIVKAIQRSTDTFFYKVGEMVGVEDLSKWAEKFGLGQTLGIDIPGEAAGLVPNPSWKEKTKSEPWFLGNTYHLSIGQGDILATPLQVNIWTAVIANGGKICEPRLIRNSQFARLPARLDSAKRARQAIRNSQCKDLGLKPETLSLIQEGMEKACQTDGTGWPLFNFNPPVACKTGTAEYGDPAGKTHAWITLYAPADNPEIAVTVLVEEGGEGSSVAGPIAKKILEEWFEK